jgi:hypothetical protein
VLLANDSKAAEEAVAVARFLATQLFPVLAHLRAPKIATWGENRTHEKRIRRLFHG